MKHLPAQQAVTRRAFTRGAIASVAAAPLGTLAARADRPSAKFLPGKFVDVHTHLGQTWNTTQPLSADELLKWMDANEVAQAVVLPLVSPEASSYPLSSDFVLQQTKPHRDRLIPFCCIDPRTTINNAARGLGDMLKRYVDQGAKGFGEHKAGLPIDDVRSMRLYGACGRAGLPVLFHIDQQRNTDKPGLPGLEKALKEFPETTFIGHGPGWWASIGGDVKQEDLGGYPKGAVAPGGAMDRLMGQYPNLYGDLSAGSGAGAIARDRAFGREFLIRRADRVMFGTDYLAPGQPVPQFELFRELDLPAEVQAKVFRENARRVLKIG